MMYSFRSPRLVFQVISGVIREFDQDGQGHSVALCIDGNQEQFKASPNNPFYGQAKALGDNREESISLGIAEFAKKIAPALFRGFALHRVWVHSCPYTRAGFREFDKNGLEATIEGILKTTEMARSHFPLFEVQARRYREEKDSDHSLRERRDAWCDEAWP